MSLQVVDMKKKLYNVFNLLAVLLFAVLLFAILFLGFDFSLIGKH